MTDIATANAAMEGDSNGDLLGPGRGDDPISGGGPIDHNNQAKADEAGDSVMAGTVDPDIAAAMITPMPPSPTLPPASDNIDTQSTATTVAASTTTAATSAISMEILSQFDFDGTQTSEQKAAHLARLEAQIAIIRGERAAPPAIETNRRRISNEIQQPRTPPPPPRPFNPTSNTQSNEQGHEPGSFSGRRSNAEHCSTGRSTGRQSNAAHGAPDTLTPGMRELSISPQQKQTTNSIGTMGVFVRRSIATNDRLRVRLGRRRRAIDSLVTKGTEPPTHSPCPAKGCRSRMSCTAQEPAGPCARCHGHTHLNAMYQCTHHGVICTVCAQATANAHIKNPLISRIPGSRAAWIKFGKLTDAQVLKLKRSETRNDAVTAAMHDVRPSSPDEMDEDSDVDDDDNNQPIRPGLRHRHSRTSLRDYKDSEIDDMADEDDHDAAMAQQSSLYAQCSPAKQTPAADIFDFRLTDEENEDEDSKLDRDPMSLGRATKKRKGNKSQAIPTATAIQKRRRQPHRSSKEERTSQDDRDEAEQHARESAKKKKKSPPKTSKELLRAIAEKRGTMLASRIRRKWSKLGQPKWDISKHAEAVKERDYLLRIEPCFRSCVSSRKQTKARFDKWLRTKGLSPKTYRTALRLAGLRVRILAERTSKGARKSKGKDKRPKTKAATRTKSSTPKGSAPTSTSLATDASGAQPRLAVCFKILPNFHFFPSPSSRSQ